MHLYGGVSADVRRSVYVYEQSRLFIFVCLRVRFDNGWKKIIIFYYKIGKRLSTEHNAVFQVTIIVIIS